MGRSSRRTTDTSRFERSFAAASSVLAAVTDDQLDLPTPCDEWDVEALCDHMVEGVGWFGEQLGGVARDDDEPAHPGDSASSAFDAGAAATVAAFRDEPDPRRAIDLGFATLSIEELAWLASLEMFTHAWDLATATVQQRDLDPELAEELLERARAMVPADDRDGEDAPFAPVVLVDASVPAADRLAAYLGRRLTR